jgi:hypothetical protein
MLDAIGAAATAATAVATAGAPAAGQPPAAWRARLAGLSPPERRQLRSFLLQARWFGGAGGRRGGAAEAALSEEQTLVLRKLPIFETHPPLPHERAQQQQQQQQQQPANQLATPAASQSADSGGEQAVDCVLPPDAAAADAPGTVAAPASTAAPASAAPGSGRFLSLIAALQQGCALQPAGAPAELLGARFVRSDSAGEESVLEAHLGVPRLRASAFLRDHVAPAAASLDTAAVAEAVAGALRGLRQLSEDDPDLQPVLRWAQRFVGTDGMLLRARGSIAARRLPVGRIGCPAAPSHSCVPCLLSRPTLRDPPPSVPQRAAAHPHARGPPRACHQALRPHQRRPRGALRRRSLPGAALRLGPAPRGARGHRAAAQPRPAGGRQHGRAPVGRRGRCSSPFVCVRSCMMNGRLVSLT